MSACARAVPPGCGVSPRRSLVVPRALSRVLPGPCVAPWWRRVAGAAVFAGAARWCFRRSVRSFSGLVVVAGFPCFGRAARFAARASRFVGFPVGLAPGAASFAGLWVVSVPVWGGGCRRLAPRGSSPSPVAFFALGRG